MVVNQPSVMSEPQTEVEYTPRPHNDYLAFALTMGVICCLIGNWPALIFLTPAVILSCAVSVLIYTVHVADLYNELYNYKHARCTCVATGCCHKSHHLKIILRWKFLMT